MLQQGKLQPVKRLSSLKNVSVHLEMTAPEIAIILPALVTYCISSILLGMS
jgi:hypothetical protein